MKIITFIVLVTGVASQYAPSVMPRVVSYRQARSQLPADLTGFDGAVAVLNCADIGKTIYLRPAGGQWEKFLVADCAGIADGGYAWMVRNNVIVEVDYKTAERWNAIGRGIKVQMGRLASRPWHNFE